LVEHWFNIKIDNIDISEPAEIQVNQKIAVKATVNLATLKPSDVQVELYQVDAIVNGTPGCDELKEPISTAVYLQVTSYTPTLGGRACPYACCRNTNIFPAL